MNVIKFHGIIFIWIHITFYEIHEIIKWNLLKQWMGFPRTLNKLKLWIGFAKALNRIHNNELNGYSIPWNRFELNEFMGIKSSVSSYTKSIWKKNIKMMRWNWIIFLVPWVYLFNQNTIKTQTNPWQIILNLGLYFQIKGLFNFLFTL